MAFYIHLRDPTYSEPPWPGERRLGPYGSAKQASAQAASDIAKGQGEGYVGVFSGSESDRRDRELLHEEGLLGKTNISTGEFVPAAEPPKSKPVVTREQLNELADELRKTDSEEQARIIEEQRRILEQRLPEGVSVDDFLTLMRNPNVVTAAGESNG